jgi:predicted ATP-grasp superfamily ATP-dependent carboligase
MTPERCVKILVHEWVTGGGLAGSALPQSWATEGRAMRRAIAADFASRARDGVRVVVTLDARLPEDPGPWSVERIQEGHRLRELAMGADWTVLIAPETQGVLGRLTRDLHEAGARILGSSPEAIDLTGDKGRLFQWLEARGIDTPPSRTIAPSAGLPPDADYPAVLKPVDGAGSVDTFYLSDQQSLAAPARRMARALLQPFVPGVPMSASFLIDGQAQPWLIGIGIQHVSVRAGRFAYHGGTLPASCRSAEPQLRPALESIPGLRGFVGVDFIWDPGLQHATVLEINPRPTTSCVGLTRLLPPGRLAAAWLQAFERETGDAASLATLADLVHGRKRLSFDAKGDEVPSAEPVGDSRFPIPDSRFPIPNSRSWIPASQSENHES